MQRSNSFSLKTLKTVSFYSLWAKDEHFPFLWLIIHVDVSFKSCLLSAPCLCFFLLLLCSSLFFLNCMEYSLLLPDQTTAVSYGFLFLCDFFLTCRVGFKAIGCAVGIQPRNLLTLMFIIRNMIYLLIQLNYITLLKSDNGSMYSLTH